MLPSKTNSICSLSASLLVLLTLLSSCDASIDNPAKPRIPGGGVVPGAPIAGPVAAPPKPRTEKAFVPSADRIALLPFHVRLNRLAAVAGVATTDSMFAELQARRLDLGAHDFGANVAPDLTWSAQRMTTWVQALFPVCDDNRMKARYPDWRTSLDPFARAAWGRPSTAEDLQLLDAAVADEPTANKWRASCLTLLSSLELVSQ
jgi:hypothetical protein